VNQIRAIIFDLDGTLYVNRELGREIHLSACRTIARHHDVTPDKAEELLRLTKELLSAESGFRVSLTRSCQELEIDIPELHRRFCEDIFPERFLVPDERVVALLKRLGLKYDLALYTNNNRCLTDRILLLLGINGLFRQIFSIEDFWRPKPDRMILEGLFAGIRCQPQECLFVGDRHDIDLMVPEQMGARIFLTTSVEELLTIETQLESVP
jgi:putative hydrolase of the HAD superfamily